MRNPSLQQRLRAFAEDAAQHLSDAAVEADDLPFEVIEAPGARAPLYCYRPLTEQFIHERLDTLSRLTTHGPAVQALAGLSGLEDYLRRRGEVRIATEPGRRARDGLRAFLTAMHHERTDFDFSPERFDRAYDELEAAVYQSRPLTAVIAPVHGLALASEELAIDEDLSLVQARSLDTVPAEAAWSGPREGEEPNVLALLTLEVSSDEEALACARRRFARLVDALRLADAGPVALSPAGWLRADAGAWKLVETGAPAALAVGTPYRVEAGQEDELRGFCNLIAKRAESLPAGELAWALARFQLGCQRTDHLQALTDHLLALRALLEPEGPGSGRMAQRVAAICAEESERPLLAERMAHAVSLERAAIAGLPPAVSNPMELVDEVAHHLRSLLRDVLCGHLDSDLVRVADELLSEAVTGESAAVEAGEAPAPEPVEDDELVLAF